MVFICYPHGIHGVPGPAFDGKPAHRNPIRLPVSVVSGPTGKTKLAALMLPENEEKRFRVQITVMDTVPELIFW